MRAELRALRVFREPAGHLIMCFFQREGASAHLFIKLPVKFFSALHAGGLVGNVKARIAWHPYLKAVHRPEEPFYGLALAVVGPRMDHLAAKAFIQAEDARLFKVRAALKEPGAEGAAIVDVHNAGELPQHDAGSPEGGGNAGDVLCGHDFPAKRAVAGPVIEKQDGHPLGLARGRIGGFKIERMAVGNNDVAHGNKVPVPQERDGALVVPCLFPLAEQRPFVKAGLHIGFHEAPDCRLGRDMDALRLKLLLHFIDALTDGGSVRVEDMPQNDRAVTLCKQCPAPVRHSALVRQGKDAARPLLRHFPAFEGLPAYLADFLKEFGPGSGHVCRDKVLPLFLAVAEAPQP